MASYLLNSSFGDGAIFHLYHAFECCLSALIASQGYDVPPQGRVNVPTGRGRTKKIYRLPTKDIDETSTHKARLVMFNELADRSKPYYQAFSILGSFMSVDFRNAALYYDAPNDLLPQQRYSQADAAALLPQVKGFVDQVWQEIE